MCGSLWSIIYVIMVFLTDYIFEKWEYSNVYAGQIAGIVCCLIYFVSLTYVGVFGGDGHFCDLRLVCVACW